MDFIEPNAFQALRLIPPLLLNRDKSEAEAKIGVPVDGAAVIAKPRSAETRDVAPATAAQYAARAINRGGTSGACRICRVCTAIIIIPVGTPFPYVAMHIIQTK